MSLHNNYTLNLFQHSIYQHISLYCNFSPTTHVFLVKSIYEENFTESCEWTSSDGQSSSVLCKGWLAVSISSIALLIQHVQFWFNYIYITFLFSSSFVWTLGQFMIIWGLVQDSRTEARFIPLGFSHI